MCADNLILIITFNDGKDCPQSVRSGSFVGRGVRIVDSIVESARFLALHGLAHNQIPHVDDVAQFAYLAARFRAFKQAFGLFIEYVQAVP